MSSIQSAGRRSVTAFFDSRADADEAGRRLRAEGVADADIRIVEGEAPGAEARTESKGFLASLADFFLPNEDRYAYAEGLSRGGYLVSVATSDGNHARVLDILDDEGAVNMDEREASWRSEGWEGYRSEDRDGIGEQAFGRPASATGGSASDAAVSGARDAAITGAGAVDTTAGLGTAAVAGGYGQPDPLVTQDGGRPFDGEQRFGRRDTSSERTRVRSYFSEGDRLDGDAAAVDQAQPVADQLRRTDVELDDERRDTADDLDRRNRGVI